MSCASCFVRQIEAAKSPAFQDSVMDIEDLVKLADNYRACAYYMARESIESSELVFVPYNYLIDPQTRKTQGLDIANSIILIDEAHNLEGTCSDAFSFSITSSDIERAVRECITAAELPPSSDTFNSSNAMAPVFDIESTRRSLQSFQYQVEKLILASSNVAYNRDGIFMSELLTSCEVHSLLFLVFLYYLCRLLRITI